MFLAAVLIATWHSQGQTASAEIDRSAREAQVAAEVKRRQQLDHGVYSLEVDAQRHEQWFVQHWDAARRAAHAFSSFSDLGITALRIGLPRSTSQHAWGITQTTWHAEQTDVPLDQKHWSSQVNAWKEAGYEVETSEWHQPRFEHLPGQQATSTVAMLLHVVNHMEDRRLTLRGQLEIRWKESDDPHVQPAPEEVTLRELNIFERSGPPAFSEVVADEAMASNGAFGPYPINEENILVADLRGGGLPDIVLGSQNRLLRNLGGMHFRPESLCAEPLSLRCGIIGDFNGDGLPDLLGVSQQHVVLLAGLPGGRFGPPERVADLPLLTHAQVITAADVFGNGLLDVLIAQYLPPYEGGQMPTPYYDANDGYPMYLLRNDGRGHFTDATAGSGLEAKRFRRVFAASFLDLDGDGRMDLLLSSDFAGNDLFLGDGHGHFRDVTATMIDEAHDFGMGHTVADFDGDGILDLYLVGMSSTTARRLESMHAGLPDHPDYQKERPAMGYGNRMYLGSGPGKPFRLAPWCDEVARTGWSWGCVSPDLDNDGWPELFVANGFVSAESSQDYCTTFWRHDIYTGSSKADHGIELFFSRDLPDFTKISWNGYEHKVLYLNEPAPGGKRSFINVAHLMGVAAEYDGRAVVAADFDGDGKVDLLVEERDFRSHRIFLHLYRNRWPDKNHWIGVNLRESPGGATVAGSVVSVIVAGRRHIACATTGDSFMSQQPAIIHVGLGDQTAIDTLEVRWGDGQTTHLEHPASDRLHIMTAPPYRATP
jgi:hypothetical protein